MSANDDIARQLDDLAQMMELLGENRFRIAALARASRLIADLGVDLATIASDRDQLLALDGVGEKVADKIQEFVSTGRIQERDDCTRKIPPGLLNILQIPGLGPKTVGLMWREKNIESVDDLKKAIADGSILDLPRMGKKTVANIVASIAFREQSGDRTPIGLVLPLAESIVDRLRAVPGADRVEYAGSLRRGRDTIGDIDILACGADKAALADSFRTTPGVTEILAAGKTKSSVRMDLGIEGADRLIQVDLRVVDASSFGAALLYFTGSKDHNVRLRERAIARELTLNEYGLFPDHAAKADAPADAVASKTETDIYEALGLPFLPAEIREDRGEFAFTKEAPPELIELADIQSELHAHTTASDGKLSIEELANEAIRRGFHTIAVTDHSASQRIANGLSADRLRQHIKDIRTADEKTHGIKILAGSEVDILADGSLDYDDDLLAQLDLVVASPHWALTQTPAQATRRLLRAIEHPLVNIIGHPTGRLIGKRAGMSPNIAQLAAAAAEHDTAMEINAHWMRLDLRDAHVRVCVEQGALIAIDCDVHTSEHFDNLRFGVLTARRGWLAADRCVNAWSAEKLWEWIEKNKA